MIFPAIRKKKFPQIKITANIFPAKIYSRVNILSLKFATRKYSTNKSCLFNHNLSLSFRNKTVYNEIPVYCFENLYFCCKYSIKTKILPVLGSGCKKNQSFLIAKLVPAKHKKSPIRKNKLQQKFRATR